MSPNGDVLVKRIVVGIILVVAGFVWAALGTEKGPALIAQFILIFLGTALFGLGRRHWWISRR